MVKIKVIDCTKQALQPNADSEDELVRFDVDYIIECLAKLRNTSFEVVGQPDRKERNLPQPDYLIRDKQTGDSIVIEYARFFEGEEKRRRE